MSDLYGYSKIYITSA